MATYVQSIYSAVHALAAWKADGSVAHKRSRISGRLVRKECAAASARPSALVRKDCTAASARPSALVRKEGVVSLR